MKAFYLSLKPETPANDYWDYTFLNDFIDGKLWRNTPKFEKKYQITKEEKAIVILPARHHKGLEREINREVNKIEKCVLFLMGDEEAEFEIERISHPNIHIWVQNPHPDRHDKYNKLGTGYTPHTKLLDVEKNYDLFFSGQITHQRRVEMVRAIEGYEECNQNVLLNRTRGFTQGFNGKEYNLYMNQAKVAPAPSGAVIPDSFRLFEALETMTVPIADNVNPSNTIDNYWDWLFGAHPIPCVSDWDRLPTVTEEILADWDNYIQKITAWWLNYKREFVIKVLEQLDV